MLDRLRAFLASTTFEAILVALILASAVLVGLEATPAVAERHAPLLRSLERLVVALFVLEAILKIVAQWPRPWRYFADPWNVFDFSVVVACLLPAAGPFAAIVRLARVLRTLRLVTAIPKLRLLAGSLLHALPSMAHVVVLLAVHMYIYAVLGVLLFGGGDPEHFGHLGRSAFTLFEVMTLEGWVDLLDAQRPHAPVAAPIYFVSFILLGTMIILNLFIGIIVNSMDETREAILREEAAAARSAGRAPTVAEELEEAQRALEELSRRLQSLRARLPR